MVVEPEGVPHTEEEQEGNHGREGKGIRATGMSRFPFTPACIDKSIYPQGSEQDGCYLHNQQCAAAEHPQQGGEEDKVEVEMVGEDVAGSFHEKGAVVKAKMAVGVHVVGVKPQIEAVGAEHGVVDKRKQCVGHGGNAQDMPWGEFEMRSGHGVAFWGSRRSTVASPPMARGSAWMLKTVRMLSVVSPWGVAPW